MGMEFCDFRQLVDPTAIEIDHNLAFGEARFSQNHIRPQNGVHQMQFDDFSWISAHLLKTLCQLLLVKLVLFLALDQSFVKLD